MLALLLLHSSSSSSSEDSCDDLSFSFDNGSLTISGTGPIPRSCVDLYRRNVTNYVIIERGITTLNVFVFGQWNVITFLLPDTLLSINNSAFHESSLHFLTLPPSLLKLSPYSLGFVRFASTVLKIPQNCEITTETFYSSTNITSFEVDSAHPSLSTDSSGSLYDKNFSFLFNFPPASPFLNFTPPATLSFLNPDGPFSLAESLQKVDLSHTKITEIPEYCFATASGLIEILIPKSVQKIGHRAFADTQISELILPEELEELGLGVFFGCAKLREIVVSKENKFYAIENGILYNKNKTELILVPQGKVYEKIELPETVIRITDFAFQNVTAKEIVFGKEVKAIDDWGLQKIKVKCLWLPDSIVYMGAYVLWDARVNWISLHDNVEVFDQSCFRNASIQTLHYRGTKYGHERGLCEALNDLGPELVVTVEEKWENGTLCGREVRKVADKDLPYRPQEKKEEEEEL
jgi:hypothetical protein